MEAGEAGVDAAAVVDVEAAVDATVEAAVAAADAGKT